jgi:predicted nicotinamide N-methyase
MAKHPDYFSLFEKSRRKEGIRLLELGAGTGLLSILCRKLLDIKTASEGGSGENGLIVATDFLPEVLANLRTCVDLNFPSESTSTDSGRGSGIHIAKLDWTTFPAYMQARSSRKAGLNGDGREHGYEDGNGNGNGGEEETSRFMDEPFDLVLASDCVYDTTHARMLREVASWTLRLPDEHNPEDQGGVFVSPPLDSVCGVISDK